MEPEPWDDDMAFDDRDDDEEAEDEAELNCGELPEGGCSLAGTEWCDWSCPFSDAMMKRMNK